jgi:hypothetical protein
MEPLTYDAIKDQYFYRTEKWDWLDEKMIHLFDSTRPRMVTMDPWSQEIFLDAVGNVTVEKYILDFSSRYPKGQAPNAKELKQTVIEILTGLAVEEHFVKFSDAPVTLEESILKPLRDQGTVDMRGAWKGTYTYGMPDQYKDEWLQKVGFMIRITDVQGQNFTGTVEDDQETGGTPGTGKITGRFTERQIWFDKDMPIYAYIDEKGEHVRDSGKKHPTIAYEGQFSGGKLFCGGTWRFKKKRLIWRGIIPHWVSGGTGRFSMEKVIE